MVFDFQIVDDLTRKLSNALPPGLKQAREDVETQFKEILQSALGRLNVVPLEEFEVQSAVLAKTRKKLQTLEKRVARLEGVYDEEHEE